MQRQYSGTAGRIENCQVGVFLAFAGRKGHALLDRELYLPKEWAGDADRREAARIPEDVAFATKPQLAERMLKRAWKAGVKAAWVTGDAVYGNDVALPAVPGVEPPAVRPGGPAATSGCGSTCGRSGSTGSPTGCRRGPGARPAPGRGRRGRGGTTGRSSRSGRSTSGAGGSGCWSGGTASGTEERAYYLCRGPAATPRGELVRVAGSRWTIEECFERAKGDCGLDEYEVRSWVGLVPARHAVDVRAGDADGDPLAGRIRAGPGEKGGPRLIPLTVPEVRALLLRVVWDRLAPAERALAWSDWRRAHQQHAKECHYKKRGARPRN